MKKQNKKWIETTVGNKVDGRNNWGKPIGMIRSYLANEGRNNSNHNKTSIRGGIDI